MIGARWLRFHSARKAAQVAPRMGGCVSQMMLTGSLCFQINLVR